MINQVELNIGDLNAFLSMCEHKLFSEKPIEFNYPNELVGVPIDDPIWEEKAEEIKILNNDRILKNLRNKANIYAIFTLDTDKSWKAMYCGQRKAVNMRDRITEHFIVKDERINSKLAEVRQAVSDGKKVGLRFIYIPRDAIRKFVEEELISRNKDNLPWNCHS
ncbi:TPA: hypothetical protein ACX6QN_003447 [Photobacterium damselae]